MKLYKKDILKDWWNEHLDYYPLSAKWRGKWQKRQIKRLIKEIDERKLDIEIAEGIFEGKVTIKEMYNTECESDYPELAIITKYVSSRDYWEEIAKLPNYSTDIKDAMLIQEKITFPITITDNISDSEEMYKGAEWEVDFYAGEFKAFEKTLPLAICKAALKIYE